MTALTGQYKVVTRVSNLTQHIDFQPQTKRCANRSEAKSYHHRQREYFQLAGWILTEWNPVDCAHFEFRANGQVTDRATIAIIAH